eukprot:9482820-Pyramimonas_sp.AAC.4
MMGGMFALRWLKCVVKGPRRSTIPASALPQGLLVPESRLRYIGSQRTVASHARRIYCIYRRRIPSTVPMFAITFASVEAYTSIGTERLH